MSASNKSKMFNIWWECVCVVLCALCVLCSGDQGTQPSAGIATSADGEMSRPVLSTHVLDTSTGLPAAGVFVELYKQREAAWTLWHNTATTADGRVLFPFTSDSMAEGTYKLKFRVEDYYKTFDKETLYPYVEITFNTKDGQHYHIPLLLSPYGYSTYRGS